MRCIYYIVPSPNSPSQRGDVIYCNQGLQHISKFVSDRVQILQPDKGRHFFRGPLPCSSDGLLTFSQGAKRCSYGHDNDFGLPALRRTCKHVEWSIIISAQAAFIFGVSCCPVSAEASSVDESFSEKATGDALISGLRRVEDGSVVSNPHTIKWRIFTDNGGDLFPKGKLDEAEKYFLLALKEAKEGFGGRDPHVASSLNNLAELYRVQKAFDKAEPLYLDAVNILEEAFGPEDVRVGAALHNLGQFYLAQRKLEKARTCYERALKIKGRVLGHGHTDYADTMYHLGTVLYLQGKEKDAEALIRDSIGILEEGGLAESATCIRRMRYLAQILVKSGRVSEAEALQRRILHVLEISKGWDSLDTVLAAEQLALTLQSIGNLVEAHELMDRCLSARKHILQEDHIQVAANMLHLARIQMLCSSQLRKVNIPEASTLLDNAKSLLDDSLRIAGAVLDRSKENGSNLLNKKGSTDNGKAGHTALIILLQSLDAIGLLEVAKIELQEPRAIDNVAVESARALRECISLYKQQRIQSLWKYPDVRAEYLSCLRHLINIINDHSGDGKDQAKALLQEMKDEIKHIEDELSDLRKKRG